VLQRIGAARCSLATLKATKVGQTLNKHPAIKAHADPRVRRQAKELVAGWKRLFAAAKEQKQQKKQRRQKQQQQQQLDEVAAWLLPSQQAGIGCDGDAHGAGGGGAATAPAVGDLFPDTAMVAAVMAEREQQKMRQKAQQDAQIAKLQQDLAERDRQLEAQEQRRRQQQQQHTEEAVAARRAAEADEAAGAAAKEGRKLECTVCMENERNVMLMPCRHVATCAACASQLKGCCPICRRPVESTHQVYL